MSHIAEVVVSHPDLTLSPTLGAVPELDLRLDSQPATDTDSPVLFYSVETPSFESFESALDADHTVSDWQFNGEFGGSRVYKLRLSPDVKILTPTMSDLEIRVLSVTNSGGGWKLRIHVPDRSRLAQFQTYCQGEDVQCEIQKLYSADAGNELSEEASALQLTDRQYEVARTATEMGYFERNGASAEEVAEELDISRSTLSTHLRAITTKVFERLFGES